MSEKIKGKIKKKLIISILSPILIVLILASSYFAILDGMVNLVESFIAKVTNIASDALDTSSAEWKQAWGNLSNLVSLLDPNGVFNPDALATESIKRPTILLKQDDFNNIRNSIDQVQVNRETAGLEDYMLKIMLLSYYRSVYLSDFDILMQITEEEKDSIDKMNAEAASDSKKYPCPFIYEKNAANEYYLKTNGMIRIEITYEDLKAETTENTQLKYYDKSVIEMLGEKYKQALEFGNETYAYSIKNFLKTTYTNSSNAYGEILVPTIDDTQKTIVYNYDDPKIKDYKLTEQSSGELEFTPINYDIVSAKYGTPVEFLMNLLEITGSRDFLNAFIAVACDETYYIKIGLYDLTTRTTNITQESYKEDITIFGKVDTTLEYEVKSFSGSSSSVCQKNIHYRERTLTDGQTLIYITDPNKEGKTYYLYITNGSTIMATTIREDINNDGTPEEYIGWKIESMGGEHNTFKQKTGADVTVTTTEVFNEQSYDTAIKEVNCWWAFLEKKRTETEVVGCENLTGAGEQYIKDNNLQSHVADDKIEELFKDSNSYIQTISEAIKSQERFYKATSPIVFLINPVVPITGMEGLANQLFNKIIKDTSIDNEYAGSAEDKEKIEGEITNNGILKDNFDYNEIVLNPTRKAKVKDITIVRTVQTAGGPITGDYAVDKILALLKDASGNVVEYADLYRSHTGAGEMLENGAEMLFQLLDSSENTEGLSDVMRYILYRYNGKDYGVTSFTFSPYDLEGIPLGTTIIGGNIQDKVWFTLIGKGYSPEAVAGVMGNIYAESGFNPNLVEAGSGLGFGLCQWTYGRRTQLEAYAAAKGVPASDINTQIEFLIAEITPGGGCNGYAKYELRTTTYSGTRYTPEQWKNASSVEQATKAFCFTFERPNVELAHLDVRISKAKEYYNKYKDKTMEDITGTNAIQLKIAEIAKNSSAHGITPKSGKCLAWVREVYEAAGAPATRTCCAKCAGYNYGVSKDFSNIPIGAAVFGESNTALGKKYGHIGIYVGNGIVLDNRSGYVATSTVQDFVKKFPNGCWGWISNNPVNSAYPVTKGLMKKGNH